MKKIEVQYLFFAISMVFPPYLVAGQDFFTLTVLVNGAEARTGQVVASLFSSDDNYLKEPILEKVMPIKGDGGAQFIFRDLKAGTYSVSIVYDQNGDGNLNTGLFGIPSEPIGFSNNVKGVFGPPSFNETSFTLSKSETISIVLGQAKN